MPIYRGGTLVGGIGVSGDGIDQDDMISFLGLHNAGVRLGTIGNAATGDPRRPDRRPGRRQQRRQAALGQLPVQSVPRHERAECLPGKMTVAAVLLSLMAGTAPLSSLRHPGLDPGPMNTDFEISTRSTFMDPGLRRDDAWASHPGLDPGSTNAAFGMLAQSVFMDPGLRRDDALVVLAFQQPAGDPPPAPPPEPEEDYTQPPTPPSEEALIEGRRRPGVPQHELPDPVNQVNPGAIRSPPPEAFPAEHVAVPDRWRLIQTLGLVRERWWDPYNQNTYKGDRPICIPTEEEQERRRRLREEAAAAGRPAPYGSAPCRTPRFLGLAGHDWFFVVGAVSDTVVEPRTFPIPVGVQTTDRPG